MVTGHDSYGKEIYAHHGENEYTRLAALAEELDPATFRRLDALGPASDWRCLDIGTGLGTVAQWLAVRCPDGMVTATDLDLRFLHASPFGNLQFLQHDITADEFPPGSFDVIHARWVFCHQRSRVLDLAKVARWLSPGGWLVIEDPAGFPLDSSTNSAFRRVSMALMAVVEERFGTNHTWAREYPQPLRELGLSSISMDCLLPVVGGLRPMTKFWQKSIHQLEPYITSYGLEPGDIDTVLDQITRGDFVDLGMASIAAWGQR